MPTVLTCSLDGLVLICSYIGFLLRCRVPASDLRMTWHVVVSVVGASLIAVRLLMDVLITSLVVWNLLTSFVTCWRLVPGSSDLGLLLMCSIWIIRRALVSRSRILLCIRVSVAWAILVLVGSCVLVVFRRTSSMVTPRLRSLRRLWVTWMCLLVIAWSIMVLWAVLVLWVCRLSLD